MVMATEEKVVTETPKAKPAPPVTTFDQWAKTEGFNVEGMTPEQTTAIRALFDSMKAGKEGVAAQKTALQAEQAAPTGATTAVTLAGKGQAQAARAGLGGGRAAGLGRKTGYEAGRVVGGLKASKRARVAAAAKGLAEMKGKAATGKAEVLGQVEKMSRLGAEAVAAVSNTATQDVADVSGYVSQSDAAGLKAQWETAKKLAKTQDEKDEWDKWIALAQERMDEDPGIFTPSGVFDKYR